MDVRCVRIRLKPGSLPRVREWAAELTRRSDEVLATLRDETARVESAFLDSSPEGDFLVYYMRVDDTAISRRSFEKSPHAIDRYHREVMDEVSDTKRELEMLIDFDRSKE